MSSSRRQSSSQPRDSTALLLLVTSTVVASIATTALLTSYRHRQDIKRLQKEWENRRQEERTGRIRAEVKLRTLLKEQEQQQHQSRQLPEIDANNNKTQHAVPVAPSPIRIMLLHCIGTVTSPFTKRMGTPRQPALVPASRGYIEFNHHTAASLLDGIEQYSHLWVIFEFHANTSLVQAKKTKIRPPRAGGIKLGQLATRSPHRPNCLGLSLVRIETWDCRTKRLHISGIDLVHGTPVYDIKPFVPWDVPVAPITDETCSHDNAFKVPDWVSQTDSLSRVDFTDTAMDALRTLVSQERLAPLYTNENDGFLAARATLEQILAQDPRSSHKGLKTNARGTTTSLSASSSKGINGNSNNSSSPFYSLVFCEMQVDFVVNYDTSMVQVVKCMEIDFDDAAYVDGIPLISKQNNNTRR